jgi:hypothetical protein
MKQPKLSLVALIAIGALSHINAATLEESLKNFIENTNISGFERLKYSASKGNGKDTSETLRLSSQLNVVSNVYDDLFFGVTLAADGYNYPSTQPSIPLQGYNAANNKGIYVDRWYFKYAIDNFSFTGGKQDITSPWTETGFNSSRGNGLSVLYSGIKNWTFAGLAFLQTNGFDDTNHGVDLGSNHNYYAIGVTGALKDIGLDLQLWSGIYENIMEAMVYTDIRYSFSGFRIRAQANYAKVNEDFATLQSFSDDTGLYYGAELRYTSDIFWVKATYSKNDKDQPLYNFDGDNGGFIKSGGDSYYTGNNLADASIYSLAIGKNFGKLRLDGSYSYLDNHLVELNEGSIGFGYRPSKNFDASLSLGYVDENNNGTNKKTKKASIELIYLF